MRAGRLAASVVDSRAALILVAACSFAASPTAADERVGGEGGYASNVVWARDRVMTTRYRRAEGAIAAGRFDEFAEIADAIFAAEADVFLPEGSSSGPVSLKWATSRLFGADVYAASTASEEFDFLAEGREGEGLDAAGPGAEFGYRFADTPAGLAAYERAAVQALDRGEAVRAAIGFEMLERTPRAVLYGGESRGRRGSWAWRLAGREDLAGRFAAAGEAADGSGKKIERGDREFAATAAAIAAAGDGPVAEWRSRFGDVDGTARVSRVSVAAGPAWGVDLREASLGDVPEGVRWLATTTAAARQPWEGGDLGRLLDMPVARPLAFGGRVYTRVCDRVAAFDAADGSVRWVSPAFPIGVAGRIADGVAGRDWYEPESDDRRLMIPSQRKYDVRLVYATQRAWLDNTAAGLSSDGRYVYAVEGSGLTTPISPITMLTSPDELFGNPGANYLAGYDTEAEGRLTLLAGGPAVSVTGEADAEAGADDPLAGVFFLGPPTCVGGRLYVLGVAASELRLYGLRPRPETGDFAVDFAQPLLVPPEDIRDATWRRLAGISPAYAGGLLVCPTASGAVAAFDPLRRRLAWAAAYRSPDTVERERPAGLIPIRRPSLSKPAAWRSGASDRWVDSCVASVSGRVLVTPRDGDELLCLSLVDGTRLWSRPRGDGLYVDAVAGGRCLVVGRQSVRAVDLATGNDAWPRAVATPQPSGRGVRVGSVYHLPTATNEIWTLSLEDGRVLAVAGAGEETVFLQPVDGAGIYGDGGESFASGPGQLVAAEGRLISQSLFALKGWPRRDERSVAVDGGDAEALAAAGRELLHDGEVDRAFETLRRSIDLAPDGPGREPYVRAVISAAAAGNRDAVGRLDDLIGEAADPRLRADLLWTVAEAHFDDGDGVTGLRRLLELAALPIEPAVRLGDGGRAVREDRIVRRFLADRDLSDAEEAAFRGEIDATARRVAGGADVALGRFVASFGRDPAAWPAVEAAAERFGGRPAGLLVGRLLGRLAVDADAAVSSRAMALLAGTVEADGRDGVTGAFGATGAFGKGRFGVDVDAEDNPFWFVTPIEISGRGAFDDGTYEVDADRETLRVRDRFGRVGLVASLRSKDESVDSRAETAGLLARLDGRVAVLSLGWRAVAFDFGRPGRPRRLWEASLVPLGDRSDINAKPRRSFDGRRRYGFVERESGRPVDPVRAVGPDFVAFRRGTELRAVDVADGSLLWSVPGVAGDGEVFGGDGRVVVVPRDGRGGVVYSAIDGRRLGKVRLPAAGPVRGGRGDEIRFARDGKIAATWAARAGLTRLQAYDVTTGTPCWTRTYGPDAVPEVVSAGREVAVVDAGVLEVTRLADGERVCRVDLPGGPTPSRDGLTIFSVPGRYVVFTATADRPRDKVSGQRRRAVFGPFAVVSETGDGWRVTASGALPMSRIAESHPPGLPVAVFDFGRVADPDDPFGGPPLFRARAVDLRSGAMIADVSIGPAGRAPGPIVGDPADGSVVARFATATMRLKLEDE